MVHLEQVGKKSVYQLSSTKALILLFNMKGKTLLAKAVANQTSATFLRVVGSELIQKYLVIE